jgi:preprotein translocase subunit YajC
VSYLIILVVLFGIMWLFLIRPQRRRQLEQAQLQDSVEPGDEILSAGGIHGTVREVEDELVLLEIAPNTVVRLDRRAVAVVLRDEPEEEEVEPEGESPAPADES